MTKPTLDYHITGISTGYDGHDITLSSSELAPDYTAAMMSGRRYRLVLVDEVSPATLPPGPDDDVMSVAKAAIMRRDADARDAAAWRDLQAKGGTPPRCKYRPLAASEIHEAIGCLQHLTFDQVMAVFRRLTTTACKNTTLWPTLNGNEIHAFANAAIAAHIDAQRAAAQKGDAP